MSRLQKATSIIGGIALLCGFGLARLARVTHHPRRRLLLLALLLAASFLPFFLYYQARATELRGWYKSVETHHGRATVERLEAELIEYRNTMLIGCTSLFIAGLALATRWPLLSLLVPTVAFVLYYRPGVVSEAQVQDVALDNVPVVWLFILCAGAEIALVAYLWTGWKQKWLQQLQS